MTYIPTGAIIAAAAAAEARRKEEEEMTNYHSDDLDGWEFKIVRSTWGKFNSHEAVQEVCRRESEAGWELLEKFDKHRLRFKRRVDCRSADQHLSVDPYRGTSGGLGEGVRAGLVLALVLMAVAGALVMHNSTSLGELAPWMIIAIVAFAIFGLVFAVMFKKRL